MLTDHIGTIRHSSLSAVRETNPLAQGSEGCIGCHDQASSQRPNNMFLRDELGNEVLRSVTPVPNSSACKGCHNDPALPSSLGMLVVDYDAGLLRRQALSTTLFLMGAGAMVLFITLLGGWWFMQRMVLKPVSILHAASAAVSRGDLSARVDVEGYDELAGLGRTFNTMGENLQQAITDLKSRDAFQQALIDAIPDGVRVIDSNYKIIAANQAYREQLGTSAESVTNTPCYLSSHCREAPCVATLVTCPVRLLKETPHPIKYVDRHRRSDGTEFDVEVYAAPARLPSAGGDTFCVVEAIRDLTEQIRYSHQQKLSDLGQLAAGVAHEIRNPLTSLQMALSYFRSGSGSEQEHNEYLELAEREIKRCIDVNDRLLKLSALPPEQTELVDLNTCVTETLSLLNFEIDKCKLHLNTQLDDRQPRVLATDGEIRMIILNLVQNAFHALSDGGQVHIATRDEGEYIHLIVEDDGHGVFPGDAERIFDPFFSRRHDGTTGSGLGLAITESLVTRHKGSIQVRQSALGGARFRVQLRNADWTTGDQA
jgi:PAS domain S-box-containing protein